jgi:hypothetical protein
VDTGERTNRVHHRTIGATNGALDGRGAPRAASDHSDDLMDASDNDHQPSDGSHSDEAGFSGSDYVDFCAELRQAHQQQSMVRDEGKREGSVPGADLGSDLMDRDDDKEEGAGISGPDGGPAAIDEFESFLHKHRTHSGADPLPGSDWYPFRSWLHTGLATWALLTDQTARSYKLLALILADDRFWRHCKDDVMGTLPSLHSSVDRLAPIVELRPVQTTQVRPARKKKSTVVW